MAGRKRPSNKVINGLDRFEAISPCKAKVQKTSANRRQFIVFTPPGEGVLAEYHSNSDIKKPRVSKPNLCRLSSQVVVSHQKDGSDCSTKI